MRTRPRLLILWVVYVVLVAIGWLAYTLGAGLDPLDALTADVRTWLSLIATTWLFAIPTYLFLFDAHERAQIETQLESHPVEGVVHPTHRAKHASLHIALWLTFVALSTATPALWLLTQDPTPAIVSTATTTPPVVEAVLPVQVPEPLPDASLLPMFGGTQKSSELIEADQRFVDELTARHESAEEAADSTIVGAWAAYDAGNTDTAMRRFNQAWLLDNTNYRSYWGMGVIEGMRQNYDSSIALLAYAIKMGGEEPRLHCDLAASYLNKASRESATTTEYLVLSAADQLLTDLEERTAVPDYCYRNWAKIVARMGNAERAQELAQKGTVEGSSTLSATGTPSVEERGAVR